MEKIGPVLWKNIHENAGKCKTPEQKKKFIEYLFFLCQNFPCNVCKPHFTHYLKENCPSKNTDLFFWSVEFHNNVNKRLGKPQMDIIDACKMYKYKPTMLC